MVTIFPANCRALFNLVSVGANSFFAFWCYTVCSFTKSRIETYFDSFFVEMCLVQTCFKFYFVSDTNKEGRCNNSSSLLLVSDGRIIQYSTAGFSFCYVTSHVQCTLNIFFHSFILTCSLCTFSKDIYVSVVSSIKTSTAQILQLQSYSFGNHTSGLQP